MGRPPRSAMVDHRAAAQLGISEFARITGISAYTLRFFDQIGLLSPRRAENGYRRYHLGQVADAQMILLLQKARLSNAQISQLLSQPQAERTVPQLMASRETLAEEIRSLQQAHDMLARQIAMYQQSASGERQLDRPFIQQLPAVEVGLLTLDTPQILDFFAGVAEVANEPAWYLLYDYGFVLDRTKVRAHGYPLQQMFTRVPAHCQQAPHRFAATEVMGMYCRGSLENNPGVYTLLQQVRDCGYQAGNQIRIENVSGPVLERDKQDFIIRILVPISR